MSIERPRVLHDVVLHHVGIAVRDLDAALAHHVEVLGLRLERVEELASHGVREAMLRGGETAVQLLMPLHPDSPVGRFLDRRGDGLHHLAYAVHDVAGELERLAAVAPPVLALPPGISTGGGGARVAFLPPAALGGVLVELVQEA